MNERSLEPDVAGDLIDALADEGQHVDDGAFTIDAAEAFRKLREHQLADPHAYILLLVEAAWLAGRDRPDAGVRIELGSTTTVEFRGLALELGSLDQLFAAALGSVRQLDGDALRSARILKLLGLAANSALALAPKQLILEASDEDGHNRRIRISPEGEVTAEPVGSLDPGVVRFEFCGGRDRDRVAAENEALVERCRYTSFPVYVGKLRVSLGPRADLREDSPTATIEQLGQSIGVAGQTKVYETPTVAWFVNRGVAIRDVVHGAVAPLGKRAVVEVDLPMDLSHKALIEDPTVEAIRSAIRTALVQVPIPKPDPIVPTSPAVRLLLVVATITALLVWAYLQRPIPATDDRSKCEAGTLAACERVLADPRADNDARAVALERSCWAGNEESCKERSAKPRTAGAQQPGVVRLARSADEIGCEDPDDKGSCVRAAQSNRVRRDELYRRGCVSQHDEAACIEMLDTIRKASAESGDHDPLVIGLAWACVSVAGPACVEAAWFYRYGFVRPEHLLNPDLFGLPDTSEAALLEHGCSAGNAEACELRSAPRLEVACTDHDDALACYAVANKLTPESIAAADKACTLGLVEGCWAAGVMHARGLSVVADREAALLAFHGACELDHQPSCAAAGAIGLRRSVPDTPRFPTWLPPVGATP